MKLAIFGATGKAGQYLTEHALKQGHAVTVLARTPAKVTIQSPNLRVVEGDILDAASVEAAVQGADAVLSVLGPASNKPELIISRGMRNILHAMHKHGVSRLVLSAGAGIRDPRDRPGLIDRIVGLALGILSKNVVADMQATVDLVRSSDLDWTIVRVPMLTDQPAQNTLKIGYVGDISPRLAREDLAIFMLKQIQDSTHIRQAPAISN